MGGCGGERGKWLWGKEIVMGRACPLVLWIHSEAPPPREKCGVCGGCGNWRPHCLSCHSDAQSWPLGTKQVELCVVWGWEADLSLG